jgi:alpha,alpha-trehalose phosphorylase
LRVQILAGKVEYQLLEGDELQLYHYGKPVTVTKDPPVVQPIPPIPPTDPLAQPVGREPLARRLREATS